MDIYIEGFDNAEAENVYEELLGLGLDVGIEVDRAYGKDESVVIYDFSDIDDTYTRNYVQQILDELEDEGYIVTKV